MHYVQKQRVFYFGWKWKKKKQMKADFKWIECDMCVLLLHSTCQDLKVEANAIVKLARNAVRWYCSECLKVIEGHSPSLVPQMTKLGNLQQMLEGLDVKLDEYQIQTNKQVECLKKSFAEVASSGQMAKDMKITMQASTSTNALLTAELQ